MRTRHAVAMFGLPGGGQADGARGGMPRAQPAILPVTTHFTILNRMDLLPIIPPFRDAPLPNAGHQAG